MAYEKRSRDLNLVNVCHFISFFNIIRNLGHEFEVLVYGQVVC